MKYRRINKLNPGYQKSIATIPGAEPLLLSINFMPSGRNELILRIVDLQLLQLGLSSLDTIKETMEYKVAKRETVFIKEMNQLLTSTPNEMELAERKELLSKCPREPTKGRGAIIYIILGGDGQNAKTLKRRFDGDDTLQDVLHWLGGEVGTLFPQNLNNRQWSLVDSNRYPRDIPIDCEAHANKTLQHLGFWPSGRLALRPSSPQWIDRLDSSPPIIGVSRGLGSAPNETL